MLIFFTGALDATFFSSSKVLAFFATKVELSNISKISIYGSSLSKSNSLAILWDITELLNFGYFDW